MQQIKRLNYFFPKRSASLLSFKSFTSLISYEKTLLSYGGSCRNFSNLISPLRFSNFPLLNNSHHDRNDENNDEVKMMKRKRIEELNDILELNPDLVDALVERSKCYEELSDWKSACVGLEKVVEMDRPPNDLLPILLEKLYWLYTRKENYNVKRATEYFERLFNIVSNDSVQIPFFYYATLYSLYFELNLFEKAIFIATEGIKSIESNGPVEIGSVEADNLAELLCRRGNLLVTKYNMMDRGQKDLDRALLLSSSKYEPLILMLDSFEKKNNHDLMLKTYELVKEFEKKETRMDEKTLEEYVNLHRTMKQYFLKRKDYKKAIECMDNYYTANPKTLLENHGMYRYLCMIVGAYPEFMESTKTYLKVFGDITADIESHPPPASSIEGTLQYTASLSAIHFYFDRFDDALRECEKFKVLLETPQPIFPKEHLMGIYYLISTFSHMKKGNENLILEFAKEAKKFYPKILKDIPEYFYQQGNYGMARLFHMESYNESKELEDLSNIADCLIAEKDYEGAIRESEKILEMDPNHHLSLFNLGEAYFYLKDLDKARQYFDKALVGVNEDNGMIVVLKEIWPQYFEIKF
ncbi:predicted protein [Naegleria gruberi]|uniref:Predicted protein n=1 Tax=Naegleria gruberi TaxID=5762 RepID=D2VWE8_NAEGR|nr:uncharacterized protein NAEGRDRAFT_73356 [Naegleria gruberi]EFC38884.1 predicted protein [Naegleria gruberi]|eukprot:XP_002671628.1 predicted protein [Naegleria gruberi strain NEG-M]